MADHPTSEDEPRERDPAGSARSAADRGADSLILLMVVAYFFGALLGPFFLWTHEMVKPYARAVAYQTEFAHGVVPAFTFPDSGLGSGATFPIFYPPAFYSAAAAMCALLGHPGLAVNATAFLAVLFSAYFMRQLLGEMGAPRAWALLGAVAYVATPYRFVLVYQRGALAEASALVWLPLIVLGIWRVARRPCAYPTLLAAAAALALLSHTITALYFALCAAAFAVAALPTARWRGVAMLGVAGLHAALLAAFYIVPMRAYLPLVHGSDAELLRATAELVQAHRVGIGQLFAMFPNGWSGASYDNPLDGMNFEMGPAPLLLLGLVAWRSANPSRRPAADPAQRRFLAVAVGAMVATVAFMLSPIVFLRLLPAPFDFIQYPWRLLGQVAFLSAFGLGLCGIWMPRAWSTPLAVAAMVLLMARVPDYQRQPIFSQEWSLGGMTAEQALNYDGLHGFTDLGEYLPRAFDRGRLVPDAKSLPIEADPAGASLAWNRLGYGRWELTASNVPETGARVLTPLLAYPIYRAVDARGSEVALDDAQGRIALRLGAGEHRLTIERRRPPLVVGMLVLSIVAALALISIAMAQQWTGSPSSSSRRKHPEATES